MNTENSNYELGQELFHKDFKYWQIAKELDNKVHYDVYRGYESEVRITRCGFLQAHWNRHFNYVTSSDITTLFN